MSALGHWRTLAHVRVMFAFTSKADIEATQTDVRLVPIADIRKTRLEKQKDCREVL